MFKHKRGDRIMPEANYNHVVSEIQTLNLSDQLRLLEQMAVIIRKKTSTGLTRSILELKGKGKDIWKSLDVKTYLDEERSSWNG
jgi:DNA-binding HxlR family transcriptional regulator